MPKQFRNVSGEARLVLDALPSARVVEADEAFKVADDRAAEVAKQPYFMADDDDDKTARRKTTKE